MHGPAIRIALRYLAGLLVAAGLLGTEHTPLIDSDQLADALNAIVTAAGVIMGIVAEWRYARAKELGKPT